MKAHMPHSFFIYASYFTTESMIENVAKLANDVFKSSDKSEEYLYKKVNFTVKINRKIFSSKVDLVQTWLIDLIYDLACIEPKGNTTISEQETLYLIWLYNDYANIRDGKRIKNVEEAYLNLYGFFGEQKRVQSLSKEKELFSREKYILDEISNRKHPENIFKINVRKEFEAATGFSPENYALLIFAIYAIFIDKKGTAYLDNSEICLQNKFIIKANILSVIGRYCTTVDELKKNKLERQLLYTKPIIKIGNKYISANPNLLISLFSNCIFWVIRNEYLKRDSQNFTNAFGVFFEMYVEEILKNCVEKENYQKIKEKKEKRADWYLNLCGYNFLVEQKSSVSLLGIKQNRPDILRMKEYIIKTWGEAAEQLFRTEQEESIDDPIKIILLYEDYYKGECLDLLFNLKPTIENDGKYWLLTIGEFETLMLLYSEDKKLFTKIVEEKNKREITRSKEGRTLEQIFYNYGICKNEYLNRFKIMDKYNDIIKLCK